MTKPTAMITLNLIHRTATLDCCTAVRLATFTAFLTAFYTFRAFFMTFYGEEIPPQAGHHAHESPPPMTVPLMMLAVAALWRDRGASLLAACVLRWSSAPRFCHYIEPIERPRWRRGFPRDQAAVIPSLHLSDVAAISTPVRAACRHRLAAFLYLGRTHGKPNSSRPGELAAADAITDPLSHGSFMPSTRSINVLIGGPLLCAAFAGHPELICSTASLSTALVNLVRQSAACGSAVSPFAAEPAWCSSTPWRWCWACWSLMDGSLDRSM